MSPLFQKTFFIQSIDPKCIYSICCCFFFASGDLEQLLQSWLWSGKLSQQHIPLRLPLLSSVRWSPSSHNHFWCLSGSRVKKCAMLNLAVNDEMTHLCHRGNFQNWPPYKEGPSCGSCPNNCEDKLCSKLQTGRKRHTYLRYYTQYNTYA